MWIDTHCHLDAAEFDADRDAVMQNALNNGVEKIVIPAVEQAEGDVAETLVRCAKRE